jgi:hypothetical protein
MPHRFEISAIATDLQDAAYKADLLGRLGCETRVAAHSGLTVLSTNIEARRGVGAIAAFMRRLECAHVKFDHICVGGAERALRDYLVSLEGIEPPLALAA